MENTPLPLEANCVALFSAAQYEAVLRSLEGSEFRSLPSRLRLLRTLAAMRLRRYLDVLRWLKSDNNITPILRRQEIEALAALRRHREIADRLDAAFREAPANAADFAYFAINELVFQRAFFEARFVLDHASGLFQVFQPSSTQELLEKSKFIDETENLLSLIISNPDFHLYEVTRRLDGLDVPQVPWIDAIEDRLGKLTSRVTDVFSSTEVELRPPSKSIFYQSPSRTVVAMPYLPNAKSVSAVILQRVLLTEVQGTINLATSDGIIFPQLSSRGSTINAGYCVSSSNKNRITLPKGFLLAPLGDPGFFNAILNGLFGMLIWRFWFSSFPLIISPHYSPVLRECANLLNIDPNDIIWDSDCELYRFNKAISFFAEGRSLDSKSLSVFLNLSKQYLANAAATKLRSELVYISRSQAKQRRLVTEIQLENALRSLGFEVVHFEEIGLNEQFSICATARIIVAPHGAGLTNIVFAERLETLIELIPEAYHVRGFENIACQRGITYVGILGQTLGGTSMAELLWTVDIELVCKVVGDYL